MIIDFRLRPPYKSFCNIVAKNYDSTVELTGRFNMKPSPSVKAKSMEMLIAEMDEAGIDMGVAPGRIGHFNGIMYNDDIVSLVNEYPGRFIGIAGVNASDKKQAFEDIERTVINGPLKGICMEPGAMPDPWYADDRRIYPIYELCEAHNIPVLLMLGGRAGPDVSYSNPAIITRVARDFPKAKFVVTHGGWPWVQVILGACFWQENIYISPDMYLFNMPGAQDYITAAKTFMKERFLFGTAYPLMPIKQCTEMFKQMFDEELLPDLMCKNALRVLNMA